MDEHDVSWVRTEMALAQPAPASQTGIVGWARKNLLATPLDGILTVLALLAVAWVLPQILNWALFSAQWTGVDRTACLTASQGGAHPAGLLRGASPSRNVSRSTGLGAGEVSVTTGIFISVLSPLPALVSSVT